MKKQGKSGLKRRITTALELPKDIMLNLPVVNIVGDEEALVSNHKGLLEYGPGHVRLASSVGQIKIFGTNLILKEISAEIVMIMGKISQITWG